MMTRFGHDAGIMAAIRQHEGQLIVGEKVSLVDRLPRRDVIGFGRDNEHGHADVLERDDPAFHRIPSGSQTVFQEKPPQNIANACDRAAASGRHSKR